MFGLGIPEILALLIMGIFCMAVPVGLVWLVLVLVRRQSTGRVAELEAENQRLRQELDRQ